MKTITINQSNAQAAYRAAEGNTKKVLEALLGKENILPGGPPESFEAAHEIFMQLTFTDATYKKLQKRDTDDYTAVDKLMVIAKVLQVQANFIPDYDNKSQKKWSPIFIKTISGFVFSFTYFDLSYSVTDVGSRLCVASNEDANFFGTKFLSIWNEFLLTQ